MCDSDRKFYHMHRGREGGRVSVNAHFPIDCFKLLGDDVTFHILAFFLPHDELWVE